LTHKMAVLHVFQFKRIFLLLYGHWET